MPFLVKVLISAAVISFSSWLAGRRPGLAGFIIALPVSSLIAIAFTQLEWRDPEKSGEFARSILVSVPLSLVFFLPFLFARSLKLPFWGLYSIGILLLTGAYFLHRTFFPQG